MIGRLVLAGAAAVSMLAATPASAQNLRMIAGWDASNTMAYMPGAKFKENLEAKDVGLTVEIFGPETVPPFEQVDPVGMGVFDLIYSHPAYSDRAVTNATNAMEPDMEVMRSSGVFDAMDSYMQETQNLKLLANVAIGTSGYHCYLREPLDETGGWEGRKIRGIATYVPIIEALGGVAVNTPMGDVYSSLDRGVVDGACAPQSVFRGTKHFEVAPYRTEPTFGQLVSYIAMNLDAWNGLSEEQQAAVVAAAEETEAQTKQIGDEVIGDDLAALGEEGVETTQFSDETYATVLSQYQDGVWQLVSDCCGPEMAEELRAMATEAGLSD